MMSEPTLTDLPHIVFHEHMLLRLSIVAVQSLACSCRALHAIAASFRAPSFCCVQCAAVVGFAWQFGDSGTMHFDLEQTMKTVTAGLSRVVFGPLDNRGGHQTRACSCRCGLWLGMSVMQRGKDEYLQTACVLRHCAAAARRPAVARAAVCGVLCVTGT